MSNHFAIELCLVMFAWPSFDQIIKLQLITSVIVKELLEMNSIVFLLASANVSLEPTVIVLPKYPKRAGRRFPSWTTVGYNRRAPSLSPIPNWGLCARQFEAVGKGDTHSLFATLVWLFAQLLIKVPRPSVSERPASDDARSLQLPFRKTSAFTFSTVASESVSVSERKRERGREGERACLFENILAVLSLFVCTLLTTSFSLKWFPLITYSNELLISRHLCFSEANSDSKIT